MSKSKRKTILNLVLKLAVLAYFSTIFYTVDQTQVVVLTRLGAPVEGIRSPGLRYKFPWPIDRPIHVDQRQLFLRSEAQEMLTDDEKNVVLEGYLIWQIEDPLRFVETAKTREDAEKRLQDLYTARMGAKVGTLPFDSFVNVGLDKLDFHRVYDEVRDEINEVTTNYMGIKISKLQITGFTLPAANRTSVINRMNAERGRIAARYRSEGTEQALKIEAKAAAEHESIMAKAHADATTVLGKGEADAMKILAAAYSKDPEFYSFIRSLESYEAIIGDQTTLFLETDSKLFKTLYDGKGK
jgi:modulator of FtsH protease HflC